jgi:hypothetical protein
MGWAFCGTDSKGREIGYGVSARCDHPGCKKRIDRGLSYACGGWHGVYAEGPNTYECCERYFCEKHRYFCLPWGEEGDGLMLCAECKIEADRLYEEAEAHTPEGEEER